MDSNAYETALSAPVEETVEIFEEAVPAELPADPYDGQKPLSAAKAKRLAHRLAASAIEEATQTGGSVVHAAMSGLSRANQQAVEDILSTIRQDHQNRSL